MIERAELYLKTMDRSANTIETYRWALDMYFRIAGDDTSDLAYERFWADDHILSLSTSTKRIIRSAVCGLYDYLEIGDSARREKINNHFMKKPKRRPVMFDIEAVEQIIGHCDSLGRTTRDMKRNERLRDLRDRAFVLLMVDAGFRISELCHLKRGDIDFDNERVIVTGKGDKTAVIRLSRRSLSALKGYLDHRMGFDGKSASPLVELPLFARHGRINQTKSITVDGMRKAIKSRMDEIGVNVRIHDFRHYFVTTIMMTSGGNLKLAQELARHSNIGTTNRYAHLSDDQLDKSYDEIFNKEQ